MKLVIAEPHLLKESISIISELVTEVTLQVTPEGIELKAMDPANVAMVLFSLSKSAFVEYMVKEKINLAMNLEQLKQVLRRAKPHDAVTLELNDENKLQLTMVGDTLKKFHLALLDLEERNQKTPNLKFPLSITMPTQILNDALEDIGVVSETVTFLGESEKFDIQARSNVNAALVEIKKSSDVIILMKEGNAWKSRYSLEYLMKMIKASKLAEKVTISFSTDYPLKMDYEVSGKMQMSFILAPRIEND